MLFLENPEAVIRYGLLSGESTQWSLPALIGLLLKGSSQGWGVLELFSGLIVVSRPFKQTRWAVLSQGLSCFPRPDVNVCVLYPGRRVQDRSASFEADVHLELRQDQMASLVGVEVAHGRDCAGGAGVIGGVAVHLANRTRAAVRTRHGVLYYFDQLFVTRHSQLRDERLVSSVTGHEAL